MRKVDSNGYTAEELAADKVLNAIHRIHSNNVFAGALDFRYEREHHKKMLGRLREMHDGILDNSTLDGTPITVPKDSEMFEHPGFALVSAEGELR